MGTGEDRDGDRDPGAGCPYIKVGVGAREDMGIGVPPPLT
jgi:hypothetical protein